jgi:CheY-like chemotaxis protein
MLQILVIDDDTLFREYVVEMLSRAGNEVKVLSDGSQVETLLAQHRFDVVISDLYMPRKDGIETISTINRCAPDVPVIAMTGKRDDPCARLMVHLGATAVLEKPFDEAGLQHALQAALVSGPQRVPRMEFLNEVLSHRDATYRAAGRPGSGRPPTFGPAFRRMTDQVMKELDGAVCEFIGLGTTPEQQRLREAMEGAMRVIAHVLVHTD